MPSWTRSLVAVVAVLAIPLSLTACSPTVSPVTPSALPAHGTPARVELAATPGIGTTGGTATITARVLDAYAALLADQAVTFATSVGTFSEASVSTNAQGIARTTLNAPAGSASVTARAGSIATTPIVVAVQPVVLPPSPPPSSPPPDPTQPNPSPSPTGPLTVTLLFTVGQAGTPTTFALALQGGLSTARWSFGDGASLTSSLTTVTHSYASAGIYAASVAVTDRSGRVASDTQTIVISGAPPSPTPQPAYTGVTMTASPTTVTAGGSITYSATAIAVNGAPAPSSYAWDCNGDGVLDFRTTLNSQACTYAAAGSVIATVVASNGEISAQGSRSVIITAVPAPPPAPTPIITVNCSTVARATPTDCFTTATLPGTPGAATITAASWSWGDSSANSTTTDGHGVHTYAIALPAGYHVTVTATVTGTTTPGVGTTTAIVQ
jgi:hypothetical protein